MKVAFKHEILYKFSIQIDTKYSIIFFFVVDLACDLESYSLYVIQIVKNKKF